MISIIVPCYNEQEALPLFYQEASAVLKKLEGGYEMLFINDGSADGTLDVLRKLAARDEHVFYLSFSRNFGKEAAMYAGFCNVRGDYVAVLDADLQHPPALLPEMLRLLEGGEYDSVAARRTSRKGESPLRSWFSRRFYDIINKISDADLVDGVTDFRLMKRSMVDAIVAMGEYNRFSKGIFGWVGFRTKWLPYENVERVAGETKWSFWKLLLYSLQGIVGFSTAPLALASVLGLVLCVGSLVMVIYIIIKTLLFGDPVGGWPSMACMVLFLGGIQLFCMGILGQYLAKTYLETKRRPIYLLAETDEETADETKLD